ncbi:MAG TPA: tetratricopeptide repeat protein [Polyangiaceae bacterium]|nr:tetratricopeptide repeat protein [Polyangiaceae bacterium]
MKFHIVVWLVAVSVTFCMFSPRSASAQSAADKVAAETLFINARKLLADGKYADACKALAESQRLDPGVGTLLNLGRCYEKLGHTASAWSTYREAAAAARAAHQPAREKNARVAADALEKKLPMSTIAVAGAETMPDLEVRRDGAVVPRALWGMSVAIDPGEHVFEASAPRRKPWRTRVVAEPSKSLTVNVPQLESDGTAAAAAASVAPKSVAPAPVGRPEQPAERTPPSGGGFGAQRVAALLAGTAGLAVTGVGGYYASRAKSMYDSASPCIGNQCEAPGYEQRVNARAKANTATYLVAGGLVAVAGSIVLWVTAPSKASDERANVTSSKPRVHISADVLGEGGARSLVVFGSF